MAAPLPGIDPSRESVGTQASVAVEARLWKNRRMRAVHVNVYIHAPIERVFEAVADHESFLRSEDGTRTSIARSGSPDPNGLGCLREVRGPRGVHFVEEITRFSRPFSFDYQIRKASLPLRHHGGQVRLTARGDGTEVDWTSSFDITVPLVGGALERLAAAILTATFTEMLLRAKARIERASAQPGG